MSGLRGPAVLVGFTAAVAALVMGPGRHGTPSALFRSFGQREEAAGLPMLAAPNPHGHRVAWPERLPRRLEGGFIGRSMMGRPTIQPAALPFLAHFTASQDPRQAAKVLRLSPEPLLLLLCGTVAGADDLVGLALRSGEHLPFLRRALLFARGIPSHGTLCEIVAALDPALFKACFANGVGRLRDPGPETIATWQPPRRA